MTKVLGTKNMIPFLYPEALTQMQDHGLTWLFFNITRVSNSGRTIKLYSSVEGIDHISFIEENRPHCINIG